MKYRRTIAFTLMELLVVMAVLVLLLLLIARHAATARVSVNRVKCAGNLKLIARSFVTFASDNKDRFPMQFSTNQGGTREWVESARVFAHFQALSNELSLPSFLVCPDFRPATIAAASFASLANSNLDYFGGIDAKLDQPRGLLSGDRFLTSSGPTTHSVMTLTTNASVAWLPRPHDASGHVAWTDGSVTVFSNAAWPAILARATPTRLAIPGRPLN